MPDVSSGLASLLLLLMDSDDDDLLHELEDDTELSRDKILGKIREKKEVIDRLRCQPWSMRRKQRTLRLSQKYLERHEAKVSRAGLWRTEFNRMWKKFRRWCFNMSYYLIPWESRIKRIESHFGSVVSSYFTFLRWIFWINLVMMFVTLCFIVIPEVVMYKPSDDFNKKAVIRRTGNETPCEWKGMPPGLYPKATLLTSMWQYEGAVEYSPMFYGYYCAKVDTKLGAIVYNLPLAYFLIYVMLLAYSCWTILRKMASNARLSKVASGKNEQYHFCWKVLVGWDFTIGGGEAAFTGVASNANKLREAIMEYRAQQRQGVRLLRWVARGLANILILSLVAISTYAVNHVVNRSIHIQKREDATAFERNEVPITVSVITLFFPNIFEIIGQTLERVHPRTALRLQLGRVLLLYLLNFYTLLFALFQKIRQLVDSNESTDNVFRESMSDIISDLVPSRTRRTLGLDRVRISLSWLYRYIQSHSLLFCRPDIPKDYVLRTLCSKNATAVRALSRYAQQLQDGPLLRFVRQAARNGTSYYKEHIDNERAYIWGNSSARDKQSIEFLYKPYHPTDTSPTGHLNPNPLPGMVGPSALGYKQVNGQNCWENYMGQEICRLITMDLVMTFASVLVIDLVRGLVVRYCNRFWCWNLETRFPEYGEFKVAENVLQIVNNQGMIWLGLFFSPLIPAINAVKIVLLMYLRSWACISCNVPAQEVFRASRSNNFYLLLLLLMLLLCTLPVGYVIASILPSGSCGPFAGRRRFYSIITDTVQLAVGPKAYEAIMYITSPGVVIPVLLLLLLVIYFLVSLCRALKETNEDLKKQLLQERTEEKKKIYALAGGGLSKPEHEDLPSRKISGAYSGVGGPYRPSMRDHPRVPPIAEDYYSSDDDDKSPLVHESKRSAGFVPSLDSLAEDNFQDSADEMGSRVPSVTVDRSLGSTPPTPTKSVEDLNSVSATVPFPISERPSHADVMEFSTEDLKRMITPTSESHQAYEVEQAPKGAESLPKLETTIWMPIEPNEPEERESEPEPLMKFSETETDSELETFTHERAGLPAINENIPARSPPSSGQSERKFKVDDVNPELSPWPFVPADARSRLRRVSADDRPPIPPAHRALSLDRTVRRSPTSEEEEEDGPPIRLPKFRITSSREATPVSSSPSTYRRSASVGPARRRFSLSSDRAVQADQNERNDEDQRAEGETPGTDKMKSSVGSLSKETTI